MQKEYENLSVEEKAWLKHILTGQIRNVLANEFGMNRSVTGPEYVRSAVKSMAENKVSQAVQRTIGGDRKIKSLIEKEVQNSVREEVKRLLSEKIEEAADQIVFNLSASTKPKSENPNFGKF